MLAARSTRDDLDGGTGVGVVGGHHHPSVHGVQSFVVVFVGLQDDVHPVVVEHILLKTMHAASKPSVSSLIQLYPKLCTNLLAVLLNNIQNSAPIC